MATKNRTCAFDGCERAVKAKTFCGSHYRQWRDGEHLRPLRKYADKTASLADRVHANTDKTGDCWLWTGSTMNTGYGVVFINGKTILAHRAAYEVANGPIPAGMLIDHKCHKPRCVKPSHIHAVTQKQNMENRKGAQTRSKSGARGVFWHNASKSWHVVVGHNGKSYSGGYFKSVEEAAIKASAMRRQIHSNSIMDMQ